MRDIYFEPTVKKPTIRKRLTLFASHWLTVCSPKLSHKLATKLLGNPLGRRIYEMRTQVQPIAIMVSTSHGNVCLNKFSVDNSESDKNIFLCHGWGDSTTRFTHLIDHLLTSGYTVWSLDHFGHGKSAGNYSHLMVFIEGVSSALAYLDNINATPSAIVGHSMGALSLMNLPADLLRKKKVILISAPVMFFENMYTAIASVGIAKSMLLNLLEVVSQQNNTDWKMLTPLKNKGKIDKNFLFIHDTTDKICPYDEIISMAEGFDHQFFTTENMGHLKLLKDPLLHAKVSNFARQDLSLSHA